MSKVKVGTEFRSLYADSNALWRVTAERAPGIWEAQIQGEWFDTGDDRIWLDDYAGVTDVFTTEKIEGSLAMNDLFARHAQERQDFWDSREIGEVLHYHNGFGQYVRGRVAHQVRDGEGKNVLIPTALVGEWPPYDLVTYRPDGSVLKGYHVRKIEEGDGWQPSSTTIYEHPNFRPPRGNGRDFDPRELDPIDLSPPERTPEEIKYHDAMSILNTVRHLATSFYPESTEEVYDLLDEIRQAAG